MQWKSQEIYRSIGTYYYLLYLYQLIWTRMRGKNNFCSLTIVTPHNTSIQTEHKLSTATVSYSKHCIWFTQYTRFVTQTKGTYVKYSNTSLQHRVQFKQNIANVLFRYSTTCRVGPATIHGTVRTPWHRFLRITPEESTTRHLQNPQMHVPDATFLFFSSSRLLTTRGKFV